MKSLNEVRIIGNLTRDPEMRSTKSGVPVCSFSVATNRSWKDKDGETVEEVEFHNCVAWNKLAEIICDYLKKGSPAFFGGYLKTSTWEDGDVKKYKTEIIVENMIMLGGKKDGDSEDREERPARPSRSPSRSSGSRPSKPSRKNEEEEDVDF